MTQQLIENAVEIVKSQIDFCNYCVEEEGIESVAAQTRMRELKGMMIMLSGIEIAAQSDIRYTVRYANDEQTVLQLGYSDGSRWIAIQQ